MEYDKGDIYEIFGEKSKTFDDTIANLEEAGIGEDFLLSLVMGSVGGASTGKGIMGALKGLAGRIKSKIKFPQGYGDLTKNIKPYGGGLSKSDEALLGNYKLQRKLSEMEYRNPSTIKGMRQFGKFNRQLNKQPMPEYKKGGKVKKDDKNMMELLNIIARNQSRDFGTGVGSGNVYTKGGQEINALIEAFNKIEIPGRMKSNIDWEHGDTFSPYHQRDLELKKQYMEGAVSEDIPLETGSSDMYSIFNPRHPDFVGF